MGVVLFVGSAFVVVSLFGKRGGGGREGGQVLLKFEKHFSSLSIGLLSSSAYDERKINPNLDYHQIQGKALIKTNISKQLGLCRKDSTSVTKFEKLYPLKIDLKRLYY